MHGCQRRQYYIALVFLDIRHSARNGSKGHQEEAKEAKNRIPHEGSRTVCPADTWVLFIY